MKHETQVKSLQRLLDLHPHGKDQAMLDEVVRIPVSKYIDDDVYQREMQTTFRDYPLVVGHASHVKEVGSYMLSDWDRIPFVVVRDKEGQLRAFLNICRHRGARIVSGKEDKLKAFVCPFHGWVYGLDGKLKGVTKPYAFPNLDFCKYNLHELPVREHHGLIWIHPTPGKDLALDAYLGELGDDLKHFDIENLVSHKKSILVRKANWKLLIKTYLEGYHVPFLHKETLSKSFRKAVLSYDLIKQHIRLIAARSNIQDAHNERPEEWNILKYASVYYVVFPNTFFIMHPDYVSLNAFYPIGPDETIWVHEMLYKEENFIGEEGKEALDKRFYFTNDVVFDTEDFKVAEDIQATLRTGGNEYHTLGLEEGLLAIFQRNIDESIACSEGTGQLHSIVR